MVRFTAFLISLFVSCWCLAQTPAPAPVSDPQTADKPAPAASPTDPAPTPTAPIEPKPDGTGNPPPASAPEAPKGDVPQPDTPKPTDPATPDGDPKAVAVPPTPEQSKTGDEIKPPAVVEEPAAPKVESPPYAAWGRVLEKFVDEQGRINFMGLAKDRADLDEFVNWVNTHSPASNPEWFPTLDHVLAYHINTYNALAMNRIIEKEFPESLGGFKKYTFFVSGKVKVGGQSISLYDYENDVIRPLGEARIHFALNCMVVSCPRLPREPFLPEKLDSQLESAARLFFSEARNVEVNDTKKVVRLSEIIDFYPKDFLAKEPTLLKYVNRFRDEKLPEDYKVKYFDYDWTVNRQP